MWGRSSSPHFFLPDPTSSITPGRAPAKAPNGWKRAGTVVFGADEGSPPAPARSPRRPAAPTRPPAAASLEIRS
jgi:hypothetical protein